MITLVSHNTEAPWRRRLFLPSYQVGEAAKYARISSQTVAAWHRAEKELLSSKEDGEALSYMQLIEVAVVAAFRKMGVSLKTIRATREYSKHVLKTEYPFAVYRFKEQAKHLYLDSTQIDNVKPGHVVQADQGGQLAWENVIGRLQEFDYENDNEGLALQWHVAGRGSPIIIDPRIAFGTPAVKGTPTWIIKGRYNAGESDSDIADDFRLHLEEVREALKFERDLDGRSKSRPN